LKKLVWRLIKIPFLTIRDFVRALERHALFTHAAATAFFLFLSLPPALLALVSLVGLIPIEEWSEATSAEFLRESRALLARFAPPTTAAALGNLLEFHLRPLLTQLQDLSPDQLVVHIGDLLERTMPPDLARTMTGIAENILGNPHPGLLTMSFIVILWSASGATRAAMRALTVIYEVRSRIWISRKTISVLLTVGFLAVWTVTIALIPVSNTVASAIVGHFGLDEGVRLVWSAINWGVGALVLLFTALLMNRFGPDVALRLRTVLPGCLLTVTLWVLLSYLLGHWMGSRWSSYNATYGTLAVVIALLLWCYLISLGLLLGAELNTALLVLRARLRGDHPDAGGEEETRRVIEMAVVRKARRNERPDGEEKE